MAMAQEAEQGCQEVEEEEGDRFHQVDEWDQVALD